MTIAVLGCVSSAALVACPTAHPLGAIQSAPSGHSLLRTDKMSQANDGSPPPSATEARMQLDWLVRLLECLPIDVKSLLGLRVDHPPVPLTTLVELYDMPNDLLIALKPAIEHYHLTVPLPVESRPLPRHEIVPAHSPDKPTLSTRPDGPHVHSPDKSKPLLGYVGTHDLKDADLEIKRLVAENNLKWRAAGEEVEAAKQEVAVATRAVTQAKVGDDKTAAKAEWVKTKKALDDAERKLMRLGGTEPSPEAAYAKVQEEQNFAIYVAMIMNHVTPKDVLSTSLRADKIGLDGKRLATTKDVLYQTYNDFYNTLNELGVVKRLLELSKEKSPPAVPSQ